MAQENQISTDQPDYGEIFHRWEFPEFRQHEHTKQWYIGMGILVGGLIVYALVIHNYLFAAILLIASLTIILFHRSNNQVTFMITEDGIVINKKVYPYETFENFYVIYKPPQIKMLYFDAKSWLQPRLPIPLLDQNPVAIRATLVRFMKEDIEREHEPTSEHVSRFLKL
jgi:hypothetical protein